MTHPNSEKSPLADGLARRVFFVTLVGVAVYVAVVILLMSSVD